MRNPTCKCGKGKMSRHDCLCGHCRTRSQRKVNDAHHKLLIGSTSKCKTCAITVIPGHSLCKMCWMIEQGHLKC